MNASFTTLASMLNGIDGTSLIALDALIKATLLFSIAGLATFALGRASAAMRHLIWAMTLASALLLPVLSIALPRWQLPVVRLAAQQTPAPAATTDAVTPNGPSNDLPAAMAPPIVRRDRAPQPSNPQTVAAPSVATPPEAAVTPVAPISWSMVVLAIWGTGATLVIARLLAGLLAVQWMSRRTAHVIDAPWLPLAVELASELGLTRRLRFAESPRATMPMACGVFNPIVMMPADASRWPVERLRIVLLHELAHVKRRDCLTHVVAQLACALYWFNPLAWMAARHVRTERERACDDLVLASGTRGPDYAEELLEIARVMRAGRFPVLTGATLAMAHRSQLEGRLMAILDPKVPRSGVSRLRAACGVALVACTLPPLATLQPWTIEPAVHAASPSPAVATSSTSRTEPTRASETTTPQPEPRPTPAPDQDGPRAQIAESVREAVAESTRAVEGLSASVAQSVGESTAQSVANSASQGAVQGAVQSNVQSVVQSNVQAHIQPMIQPMVAEWGIGAGGGAQSGKQADPRMVAALTAALKDSDKEVRETAMNALIRLRDPSIFEPLVLALKDSSPDVREQAVRGLAQMRDKRAVEPLMGVLKDTAADVREAAVQGLSELRDLRAFDGILAALRDESPAVREKAAFALGQFHDKRAVPALNAAVKDPNADVREHVVFALGQLRDVSAVEGLSAALRDEKADVREKAAFALGQIRDKRAVEPLISALKDAAPDVRQQAAFALGQMKDRTAVEALIIALKDSVADVREKVAFALGQLGDPRAIEALTNALKDPQVDVRRQAAFALGQLAR
jgi:HEAT repeat protein/beta-lactamase regulating signal transducer with metallopeptidase domain